MRLSRDSFADFKIALRELFPGLRSAHADEALASAFGYRTYASLNAAFAPEPIAVAFDQGRLMVRLVELGYAPVDIDIVSKLFRRHFELAHDRMWAIPPANDNGA